MLYTFCSQTNCADGKDPDAPLYIDTLGNIYGTTPFGGQPTNAGVVFELSPNGSAYTESVPYSFCTQTSCADGADPRGGVIMDASGNLYGTTATGGDGDQSSGQGVVFKLSPNGTEWQYSDLENFDGADGNGPLGALIMDSNGNLFGTTASGGSHQHGNVFEFNGSIQSLYSFCPLSACHDGAGPLTGVIEDNAGNFYGVTSSGGNKNKKGVLYELSP